MCIELTLDELRFLKSAFCNGAVWAALESGDVSMMQTLQSKIENCIQTAPDGQ